VADPDQAFGGDSQIGGRENIFTCEIPLVLCDNRWVSHKRVYLVWTEKVAIFVGRNMQSFMESQQFKIILYH